MTTPSTVLPLDDIRVVEFGSFLAGPFSTRFFGDFGAEVIKVEAPGDGDPMRTWGQSKYKGKALVWPIQSRNKKSVTIDLKKPEGLALCKAILEKSDVVVENFRPGVMEKLGLGFDELQKINPDLIMVRVSGYGQYGPYKNRAGFGSASGAMGGLRHLTGYPDLPPTRVGLSLEDSLGSLQAVIGTLLALRAREQLGAGGQVVDVAITEAVFAMTEGAIPEYALTGHIRNREGTGLAGVAPSNIYQSKDGIWMVIAANADKPFKRLFELLGRPDMANDQKYMSHEGRWEAAEELDRLIGEWAAQYTAAEITDMLEPAGVPSAPIFTAKEIYEDPHFHERDMILTVHDPEIGDMPMPGVMPKLMGTPGRVQWTGPDLGQHNHEIFTQVGGLSEAEYEDYRSRGVI